MAFPFAGYPSTLSVPLSQPTIVGDQPQQIGDKLDSMEKSVRKILELHQDANPDGLPSRSITLTVAKYRTEKIPNFYSTGAFYGGAVATQVYPKTEEVETSVKRSFYKPDGSVGIQTVVVKEVRPKHEEISKVTINRIPEGGDILEYFADAKTNLSDSLFQALKKAATETTGVPEWIVKDFNRATGAVWGDTPLKFQLSSARVDSAAAAVYTPPSRFKIDKILG